MIYSEIQPLIINHKQRKGYRLKLYITILITLLISACGKSSKNETTLNTSLDSVSYGVGIDMATRLQDQFTDIDPEIMIQGIRDKYKGEKLKLTKNEKRVLINNYVQVTKKEKIKTLAETNQKLGDEFLKENLKNSDVKVSKTGLQYRIIRAGTGIKPKFRDRVQLHYSGRLLDGTIFDSSYERGQPATFPLGGVIPGFSEGLMLMSEGAKYELFMPGNIAYGQGNGPGGPNSLLIFEVELLKVIKPNIPVKKQNKNN